MAYWILYIIFGFTLLIFGANWLVNGASSLAKRFQVSDLAIGLTIVAFGTSAPELIVNIIASANDRSDIVLGNIIGSNNFNLFVILGIAGLIYPIRTKSSTAWKEIPISLTAAILVYLLANDYFTGGGNDISRLDGVILLLCFFGFLYYVFLQMKKEKILEEVALTKTTVWKIVALIVIGLTGLVIGGQLVVKNSVAMASAMGISEKTIGLTIVAAGTSLPELVTSVVAAVKRNSDIAIGNVIGSNVFNLFLILGTSSIIAPIAYHTKFNIEIYLLCAGTVILILGMLTGVKRQLDRWEAGILLGVFALYMCYLLIYLSETS
jgi:cation:H+ antiporter